MEVVFFKKKIHNDGWIELDKTHKIKVDYPTIEQKTELDALAMKSINKPEEMEKAMLDYYRKLIYFTIKGWEGFDEKFETDENGLMKRELYEQLTYSVTQTFLLGELIAKELEFNDIDKKK